ncbi:secretin N-terminal domain-containing protein [Vibrio cidicii]|uniref:secretin N-terminal domain-containing protein n=1 Tax=Vibrio cidicii TaxID=1763883 RepID=UPI0037529984
MNQNGEFVNGIVKSMALSGVLLINGCVTTGNEDVNSASYADFDLGPSPLYQESKQVDGDTNRSNTTDNVAKKGSLKTSKFEALPAISGNQIGLLNDMPIFAEPDKLVSILIDEMNVSEFIHHVYGDLLNLDYAIDPKVEEMRTKVVLRLQNSISKVELYKIAADLLENNKVSISSKDNILYFQSSNTKEQKSKPVGIGSRVSDIPNVAGDIVQLIPYTFNSSQTIQRIATKLTNATLFPYDEQKLIVAEGKYDELVRVVQLVNTLDVPSAKGRDIRYLSFVYIGADEMVNLLSEILKKEGLRIGDSGDVAFVTIPRQNSVISYATSGVLGERIVSWARKLDKPEEGDKAKFYIYRPTFSKAEDLYESLQNFVTSSSGGANQGASKVKDKGATVAAETKADSIIQSNDFKISVDKVQNSLLIQATPMQYRELLALVEQLDKLPPQIALDVAIAEFDITDNFTAGISKILYDSSASNANKSVIDIKPTSGSISFSGVFDSTTIDMSLIAEKSKSRVLSRPYLVVQDGQSASISAGKQVPIQTGSNTTDGGSTKVEIQYRNTGVSLSVTPTINADGVVSLELSQSVSKSEPGPADLNPIITDRTLSTSVLVGNGQTAILGGLIQNNEGNRGNSVPFLSDIPLLGNLFKAKADTFSRSELVIMITPKILSDGRDLNDFSDSMKSLFSMPIGQDSELEEQTNL